MPIFNRQILDFNTTLSKYFSFRNETKTIEPLAELFRNIRKSDFSEILQFLKDNPEVAENFSHYIKNVFHGKPFNLSLTEANILSENAFYPEFKKRLLNKILPAVENEETIWFLVDSVSVTPKRDLVFLRNLPEEELDRKSTRLNSSHSRASRMPSSA